MKNSDDKNLIICEFIQHYKWETLDNYSSQTSVYDWKSIRIRGGARQGVLDAVHKLQVQILALVRIPFAGLGEFGIRVGGETNVHLARPHEFSFDLFPGTTSHTRFFN